MCSCVLEQGLVTGWRINHKDYWGDGCSSVVRATRSRGCRFESPLSRVSVVTCWLWSHTISLPRPLSLSLSPFLPLHLRQTHPRHIPDTSHRPTALKTGQIISHNTSVYKIHLTDCHAHAHTTRTQSHMHIHTTHTHEHVHNPTGVC